MTHWRLLITDSARLLPLFVPSGHADVVAALLDVNVEYDEARDWAFVDLGGLVQLGRAIWVGTLSSGAEIRIPFTDFEVFHQEVRDQAPAVGSTYYTLEGWVHLIILPEDMRNDLLAVMDAAWANPQFQAQVRAEQESLHTARQTLAHPAIRKDPVDGHWN